MSENIPARGRPIKTQIEQTPEGFALSRKVTVETRTVEVEKLYVQYTGSIENASHYSVNIDFSVYHYDAPSIIEAMRILGGIVAERVEKSFAGDDPNNPKNLPPQQEERFAA
jgi:hypothetical protein